MGDQSIALYGGVTAVYIESYDQLETDYHTNITKGFGISTEITYRQLDQVSRALNNLTLNTYRDSTVVKNISVNEVLMSD